MEFGKEKAKKVEKSAIPIYYQSNLGAVLEFVHFNKNYFV